MSITGCEPSPWTVCATFLPLRSRCILQTRLRFRRRSLRSLPLPALQSRPHSFSIGSEAANPQIPGYDIEINTSPAFPASSDVLFVAVSRSDYMVTGDLLAPGITLARSRSGWQRGRSMVARTRDNRDCRTPAATGCKSVRDPGRSRVTLMVGIRPRRESCWTIRRLWVERLSDRD